MKTKYLIIIILTLFFASCTDLSNKIFDGLSTEQFPENEAQLATFPVKTYSSLQPYLDWGGWWFAQEITTDEMVCPTRGEHWDDGGKWRELHTHEWTNMTEAVNTMWSTYYEGIFQANKAIDFLSALEQTDDLLVILSKLKVMRAFYYWCLIDNYGDVPYVTTTDLPEGFLPEKETRENIYNNIVTEIEEAGLFIPQGGSTTSANKGMAYTLLAKLYLNAEVYTGSPQWAKAEQYIDSVLAMNFSLEADALGPFVTVNENSSENIFTIPYDEEDFTGFNLHRRTLHYQNNLTFNMTVGPWNGFATMEDHYNSYEPGDARLAYFLTGQQVDYQGSNINDAQTGTPLILTVNIPALNMQDAYTEIEKRMSGARVVKFEVALGAKEDLSNDFPIFRFADVLLMKAEVLIRQNGAGTGDSWINQVRSRAGVGNMTGATLDDLLAERGREMFFEGHRRQDLIRFGKFGDAWWEKSASGTDRETFPIPQWAVDANPNLAN